MFTIAKFVDEQQLVFGYANVSVSKSTARSDGGEQFFDLQKDSIPPEELEKGAYDFVLDFREADDDHHGPATGKLVESMVFTPEKLRKFATDPVTGEVNQAHLDVLEKVFPARWWVGFKMRPESYAAVKSGKFSMFSVAGEADRLEV